MLDSSLIGRLGFGAALRLRRFIGVGHCFFYLSCLGGVEQAVPDLLSTAVRCRVSDASTGKPVSGASVTLARPGRNAAPNSYRTDALGECRINSAGIVLSESRLWCLADGYAARRIDWDEIQANTVSNTFSVRLERGTSGGALILDEQGHPLPNAQIFVQTTVAGPGTELFGPDEYHFEVTGADGRWTCRHLPAELKDMSLRVLHGDFAPVTFKIDQGNADRTRQLSAVELRDGTAVMFAQRGVTVSGLVIDSVGRPVEGARILCQDYPVWTPVDGRFTLKNCPKGENTALVQAKGFAPQLKTFDAARESEDLRWEMTPSPGLRLVVTDWRGRPLRDAAVRVEKWSGPTLAEWRWQTDSEGRMSWDGAPTSDALYSVTRAGFEPLTAQPFSADGRERAVKMRQILAVIGRVVDSTTGQPLGDFHIIPGRVHGDHHHWDRRLARPGTGGQFSIPLAGVGLPRAIKIEADGYYPEVSRPFGDDEEEAAVDFSLQKGEQITGVVNNADGKPVAGASIAIVAAGRTVLLGRARFEEHDQSDIHETDDAGRFLFQPRRDAEMLVAVHAAEGFAQVTLRELRLSPVVLQGWGRLEGQLLIRGQPAANRLVGLSRLGTQAFVFHVNAFSALTDRDGRFTLEKIPPGRHLLGRVIRSQFSHAQDVEIQLGATTRFVLAGSGRSVVGRVLASDEAADWESWNHPAFLRTKRTASERPKDSAYEPSAQRAHLISSAHSVLQATTVSYVLTLEADGRFGADDVPPGDYELEIHYHGPPASTGAPEVCRGILKQEVTIPEAPTDQPDRPVHLGTQPLTLKPAAE